MCSYDKFRKSRIKTDFLSGAFYKVRDEDEFLGVFYKVWNEDGNLFWRDQKLARDGGVQNGTNIAERLNTEVTDTFIRDIRDGGIPL